MTPLPVPRLISCCGTPGCTAKAILLQRVALHQCRLWNVHQKTRCSFVLCILPVNFGLNSYFGIRIFAEEQQAEWPGACFPRGFLKGLPSSSQSGAG